MTVLWIAPLPEEVRKKYLVTDIPAPAMSWILGHLPPPGTIDLHVLCPVFGMRDAERHFDEGGVHWHCFRLKRFEPVFLRYRFYLSIRRFVAALCPDVVHGWGGETGCGLVATYCSQRAIVGVQGLLKMLVSNAQRWHLRIPEAGSISAAFRRLAERLAYKRAQLLLVEGETAKCALKDLYGKDGVVVPHPLRVEFCDNKHCKTQDNHGRILFVGQITARKGPIDALRAFELSKNKSLKFIMIGSGDQDAEVDAFILGHGLEDRVQRIQACSTTELASEMDAADCLIVPSYGDTGPTILKEALSRGLYPVCYDNTGARELVGRYGYGRLCQTGDVQTLATELDAACVDTSALRSRGLIVAERVRRELSREAAWGHLLGVYGNLAMTSS